MTSEDPSSCRDKTLRGVESVELVPLLELVSLVYPSRISEKSSWNGMKSCPVKIKLFVFRSSEVEWNLTFNKRSKVLFESINCTIRYINITHTHRERERGTYSHW